MSESIVRFNQVSFTYRGNSEPALEDVSFSIPPGSRTLILGSNGSGKSTLVRLITGLLVPDKGNVYTDGQDTGEKNNLRRIRRKAGLLFQNPSSQIVATVVREDTAFGPENLGLNSSDIKQRVEDALSGTGLSTLTKRATHDLSAGQQQRLALAGVLALGSGCLILDEAASMLNPSARSEIDALLDYLHEKGHTIIQVTHFMHRISSADKILILNKGKLVFSGDREAFLARAERLHEWSLKLPGVYALSRELSQINRNIPLCLNEADLIRSLKESELSLLPERMKEPKELYQNQQPLISLKRVNFDYNSHSRHPVSALRNMDFTLYKGETPVLMGTTGSGKSTLLQILNSLLVPREGEVTLLGENPMDQSCDLVSLRRRIGLVMQQPEKQLFAPLVGDDIAYGPRLLGLSGRELSVRVKESLEMMELSYKEFRDRPVRALSGGQKRKVALAGILAMKPEILLLDEPTAGLDPLSADYLETLLLNLRDQGIHLVFSTHDVDQAIRLGSRLIVLDRGEKVFDGAHSDFFHRHDPVQYGLEYPLACRIWSQAGLAEPSPLSNRELCERLGRECNLRKERV